MPQTTQKQNTMKTNSHLYTLATSSILAYREAQTAHLAGNAVETRQANITAHREAAVWMVHPANPLFHIASLVSQTLTIGRESDGYPALSIPVETKNVLLAAAAAGMLPQDETKEGWQGKPTVYRIGGLAFKADFSGLHKNIETQEADYQAWKEHASYVTCQKQTKI